MGRRPSSGRYTVEECPRIDIFQLKKKDTLYGIHGGDITYTNDIGDTVVRVVCGLKIDELDPSSNFIRLVYNLRGEKLNYTIPIVSTLCHFGGVRYWFKCWCGKRVAKLYLAPGRKYFDCRYCCNLYYRSQKEKPDAWLKKWAKVLKRYNQND